MIILEIDVRHILPDYPEGQPKIASHPNTPFAASRPFESMQTPPGKQRHLLYISRLLNGVENIFDFCHEIRANASRVTSLIETFQPRVPEASDLHVA
jgi:hypothetical protein